MAWFTGQLVLLLVLAFLAGLFVGWLVWIFGWRSRVTTTTETTTDVEVDRRVAALVRENDELRARLEADPEPVAEESAPTEIEDPVRVVALAGAAEAAVHADTSAQGLLDLDPDPEPDPEPAPDAAPEPAVMDEVSVVESMDAEAVALVAGIDTPSEPDDLTRVEGIGPKMNAALQTAGITTFVRLARADENELRSAIVAGGLRFAPSLGTWARQSAHLARGDDAGHRAYADRLVAGREVEASS